MGEYLYLIDLIVFKVIVMVGGYMYCVNKCEVMIKGFDDMVECKILLMLNIDL